MIANTAVVKNTKLAKLYTYQTYVCASDKNHGTLDPLNNPTCGHHCIRATACWHGSPPNSKNFT